MKNDLTFQLDDKLTFADVGAGQEDQTMEIHFRGPTYREMDQATKIEQHIYWAFKKAQEQRGERDNSEGGKDGKDNADETMNADQVLVLLSMFSTDMNRVLADFEKLALKVGYINEKTDLLPKHLRTFDIATIKRLCGEYIANFIMPSVLSTMERAFSDG